MMQALLQPVPPREGRYRSSQKSCLELMAPRRCLRIMATASTGSMPVNSTSAMATSTGARPSPATQCTPRQGAAPSLAAAEAGFGPKQSSTTSSHFSMMSSGGFVPSAYSISCMLMPADSTCEDGYVCWHTRTRCDTFCFLHSSRYCGRFSSFGASKMRKRYPLLSTRLGRPASVMLFSSISPASTSRPSGAAPRSLHAPRGALRRKRPQKRRPADQRRRTRRSLLPHRAQAAGAAP
mmetsp:Transcript_43814/g.137626  ORF Transcript_43814/g.137626 Transcript_43814/m.137626 type:complete len:237 (+) Transcript_43814:448-1158(+)